MSTFIVGLLFAGLLAYAGKKTWQDMKAGKCAGCSSSCNKKNQNLNLPDKDKILL